MRRSLVIRASGSKRRGEHAAQRQSDATSRVRVWSDQTLGGSMSHRENTFTEEEITVIRPLAAAAQSSIGDEPLRRVDYLDPARSWSLADLGTIVPLGDVGLLGVLREVFSASASRIAQTQALDPVDCRHYAELASREVPSFLVKVINRIDRIDMMGKELPHGFLIEHLRLLIEEACALERRKILGGRAVRGDTLLGGNRTRYRAEFRWRLFLVLRLVDSIDQMFIGQQMIQAAIRQGARDAGEPKSSGDQGSIELPLHSMVDPSLARICETLRRRDT